MDSVNAVLWVGIVLCVVQSGIFSGLNLAMFGISALRLEVFAADGNEDAARLLEMRRDSNFLLTTILWGNVGTNVLLTMLSDSVMAGGLAFVFSTFVITFGGEILPQAYFSRNALAMATLLRPVLRFWQIVLYPLAKPSALALDAWLGKESLDFLGEAQLRQTLMRYIASPTTDIGRVEGIGALNFLAIDDVNVLEEGEAIDPTSVIALPEHEGEIALPSYEPRRDDPFLQQVAASDHKWVIFTNERHEPKLVVDADGLLRDALIEQKTDPQPHCHTPIVITDPEASIGDVLPMLRVQRLDKDDDVIDNDVVLVWTHERRVITGADLLGRLLRGIARSD